MPSRPVASSTFNLFSDLRRVKLAVNNSKRSSSCVLAASSELDTLGVIFGAADFISAHRHRASTRTQEHTRTLSINMSLFGQAKRHVPTKPRRSPLPFVAGESEKFASSPLSSTPALSGSRWMTIVYLPIPRLPFGGRSTPTLANGYSSSKTFYAHHPRNHGRTIGVPLPIPPKVFARFQRLHPVVRVAVLIAAIISTLFICLGFKKNSHGRNTWSPPFKDPSTLVLTPQEVAKIWEWEVLSGHHPSLEGGESPKIMKHPTDLSARSSSYSAVIDQSHRSQYLVTGINSFCYHNITTHPSTQL